MIVVIFISISLALLCSGRALLADVFEAFRGMALLNYKLDPAFYITSPHLSFDAMLRKTWGKLELITDPAMFEMIDGGIRGGVAMISTR